MVVDGKQIVHDHELKVGSANSLVLHQVCSGQLEPAAGQILDLWTKYVAEESENSKNKYRSLKLLKGDVKWYQSGLWWLHKVTSRPLQWDRWWQKNHATERPCLFLVPSRNYSWSWQETEAGVGQGLGVHRGGLRSWRPPSREGLPAVVLTGCRLKHRQSSARLGHNCQAAWGQRPAQDCGCPDSAWKQPGLHR